MQNLDSSEISLTDVSHYFDSDPTKLVAGLRDDGKMPSAFIADTTTANAQVGRRCASAAALGGSACLPPVGLAWLLLKPAARLPLRICQGLTTAAPVPASRLCPDLELLTPVTPPGALPV